jgi:exosome complex component RRP41
MESNIELIKNGIRTDGRKADELRKIKVLAGVVKNAKGSAYIEWGNNKIIAAVYGPKEVIPVHEADPKKAIIKCRYSMAPFSSKEEHGKYGQNRRSIEISKVIKHIFEEVVFLEKFPGSEIDIYVEVLQGDGGTRVASITAAAVAMAISGIPMKEVPVAIGMGKINGTIVVDLNKIEDNFSDSDVPIAFNRKNEFLLLQADGLITKEEFRKIYELAVEKSKTVRKEQVDAIKDYYKIIGE